MAPASVKFNGGRVALNFSEFDRNAFLLRSLGMEYFRLPIPFFIGHRGTHRVPKRSTWMGIPIFADPECRGSTDRFKWLFGETARKAVEFILRRGLARRVVVKFFDEPDLGDERTIRALRTLASF